MKKIIKAVAFASACCLTVSTFVACSSGSKRGEADYEYDYTWSDQKITYTFYGQSGLDKSSEDKVLKTVEDKFNVTIKLESSQEWESTLATRVNSNRNVPDVFFSIPDGTSFPMWVNKGYVVPFDGFLDKLEEEKKGTGENGTSNLKALYATEQLQNTDISDIHYFAPQVTGVSNHILVVNDDWRVKWAMETKGDANFIPTKISDFTAMLQAFHDGDYGNKGSDKTYGLGLNENFDFTEAFLSTFGVSPSYTKNPDGSYQLSALTEGYDDYIAWLRAGCANGYIYPNFGAKTESSTQDDFQSGKIGAYITTCNYTFTNQVVTMQTQYNTKVSFLPFPSSDDGVHVGSPVGDPYYWGGWCVSVNAKEPYRLIAILDYLMGDEGQELFTWGVEGEYFTKDAEGNKSITPENLSKRYADGANLFICPNPYNKTAPAGQYKIGSIITPTKFKIENGRIESNTPYELLYQGETYQKAYDEYVTGLEKAGKINFRQPTFLVEDYDMVKINNSCLDYVKTYTVNAAMATSDLQVASYKSDMERSCSSKGINEFLDYLKEKEKN